MKKEQDWFQQGDLQLIPASIPKHAKLTPEHNGVLLEGEATGHMHKAMVSKADKFFFHRGTLFMEFNQPTEVIHDDHQMIVIPKGSYKMRVVKEEDPITREVRIVRD